MTDEGEAMERDQAAGQPACSMSASEYDHLDAVYMRYQAGSPARTDVEREAYAGWKKLDGMDPEARSAAIGRWEDMRHQFVVEAEPFECVWHEAREEGWRVADRLDEDERRALAHITGRTLQGSFAGPLFDWSAERWAAAVEPLERAGIVKSGIATAADDPTVTRGWGLAQPAQTEREQGVPVRLTDGVGEGADRNVTDIDETAEPPRDHHWSVEQARWVVDDPAAVRAWLLAQDDVQQPTRQHPAAGPGDEPYQQHPLDTGYYGSHDVTPGERASWDAETEPQDRAADVPTVSRGWKLSR